MSLIKTSIILLLVVFASACRSDQTVLILEDGEYFDGNSFIPFKEIIIEDSIITEINAGKTYTSGKRISLRGKYLLPGFIDAHQHLGGCPCYPYTDLDILNNANSNLMCGITTVVDLFLSETELRAYKRKINRSPEKYTGVIMSGPMITAPGGHGTEYGVKTTTITTIAETKKGVNDAIDAGADVIKLVYERYSNKNSISKQLLKCAIETAHRSKRKVFVHINRAAEAVDCAEAGADVLAHLPRDSFNQESLKILKKSGIIIIPTVTVAEAHSVGFDSLYFSHELLKRTINPLYAFCFPYGTSARNPDMQSFKNYMKNLRDCIAWQIPIVAGTDAGNYAVFYGYSLFNELEHYVANGLSISDALKTCTENFSLILPDARIGKIRPGYYADLVAVNESPLTTITNCKKTSMVIHRGIIVFGSSENVAQMKQ